MNEEHEASSIFNTLLEQLRYEKGGTAGSYQPTRIFLDALSRSKKSFMNDLLFEECLAEESLDRGKDFQYSEFLCYLHKRIRAK